MHRLFIAIHPPPSVVTEMERVAHGLPHARWVEPHQYHITVRFIGEVDAGTRDAVATGLSQVRAEPFSLTLDGVGTFSRHGKPTTLWVGVAPSAPLESLREQVDTRLRRAGVALERKRFTPHLTLARLKGTPVRRVLDYVGAHIAFSSLPFAVGRLALMESTLTPSGADHRQIASFPLDGVPEPDDVYNPLPWQTP